MKPFKTILKDLKKAAEGDKPEKLAVAAAGLLEFAALKKPAKASSAPSPAGKAPTEEEVEECVEAVEKFGSTYDDEVDDDAAVQHGPFGGRVNWKVVIPIIIDLVKKIVGGSLLAEETEGGSEE